MNIFRRNKYSSTSEPDPYSVYSLEYEYNEIHNRSITSEYDLDIQRKDYLDLIAKENIALLKEISSMKDVIREDLFELLKQEFSDTRREIPEID